MPKPEIRMTKEIQNLKSETAADCANLRALGFGLLSDFVIRHSGFARVG
jgi:hypothetical protein